jgi:benzoyl-CoA 2,3-dioxygenase component A
MGAGLAVSAIHWEPTMGMNESAVIQQHLIDPEICIRCNTCEATCPVGAITHDSRNYVVDADKCNLCMACVPPCPTGSIDNWRSMPRARVYSVAEQLSWDELPAALPEVELQEAVTQAEPGRGDAVPQPSPGQGTAEPVVKAAALGATVPPWSAAHPFTNLYGPNAAQASVQATVVGNHRVTAVGEQGRPDYDTHHLVLDFGPMPFPVLEGQSIGIVPPGTDASGRPHHARQYSVASPRNGERAGYNNLSLTVKRVLEDHQGRPVRGVASNYLCDLKVGDSVQVMGPFGASFLMPNHPRSALVMICTGTGSAPMRAMTEWRRRQRLTGKFDGGKLMLFFGARTPEELPYFGPLQKLPKDFIDIELAFSREAGRPKRYVQDALRARAADVAALLNDDNAYFFLCGLKAMEEGVVLALRDVAEGAGIDWTALAGRMKALGRLQIETY